MSRQSKRPNIDRFENLRNPQHAPRARGSPMQQSNQQGGANRSGVKVLKRIMSGDLPLFNDWSLSVSTTKEVLIFGGCRPDSTQSSSDLFRWELKTYQWTDLTNKTKHHLNPADPMAELSSKPFPPHHHPAIALLSLGNRQFMLMFGGQVSASPSASLSSSLYALDLETLCWHEMSFSGPGIRARMSAAMATVDHRIYIFGGLGNAPHRVDATRRAINTYSIAEYDRNQGGRWHWLVRDAHCPEDIELGYVEYLHATVVYGGKKILLTGGRRKVGDPLELSSESCILFDTKFQTFQKLSHTHGQFPGSTHWYNLGIAAPPQSSKRAGRVASPHGIISPTVIIAGWTNVEESVREEPDDLAPELWKYSLPPLEECQQLNLQNDLYGLNLDLQKFVAVAGRLFFFGRKGPDDQVYNVCVEVKI